jgi:hypothetical protein
MITGNVVAALTPSLKALIQKIREEFTTHAAYQGGDSDVIEAGLRTLAEADGQLLGLAREEKLIQTDPDSSDEGKRKLMIKAVQRSYDSLGFVRKAAQQKTDAATDAKNRLVETPKAQTDPLIDALHCFEVRQLLRTLTEPQRMQLYADAIANKDVAVIRAITNNPTPETLIPKEYVERIETEYLAKTKRGEWARLGSLQFVAERLTLLGNALEYALGNYGNTPSFLTPPIRRVDLHQTDQTAPPSKNSAVDVPPPGGIQGLQ